jgi:hypothetical protein
MDPSFTDPFDAAWSFNLFPENSLFGSGDDFDPWEPETQSTPMAPEVPESLLPCVEPHAQEGPLVRKRTRMSFTTEAHREINQWFAKHLDCPYQTKAEEDWVMVKYDLSRSQVRNAFNNRRERFVTHNTPKKAKRMRQTPRGQWARLHPSRFISVKD